MASLGLLHAEYVFVSSLQTQHLEADQMRNSEVFENIKKDLFDDADAETYDLDAFDGYDELPAEAQTKVAKGFELMHGSARFISVLFPC